MPHIRQTNFSKKQKNLNSTSRWIPKYWAQLLVMKGLVMTRNCLTKGVQEKLAFFYRTNCGSTLTEIEPTLREKVLPANLENQQFRIGTEIYTPCTAYMDGLGIRKPESRLKITHGRRRYITTLMKLT